MRIVDFLAGILASALSGTGVGGGGLFIIYLGLMKDLAQSVMQGINLIFFEASAIAALPIHAKKRRINVPLVLIIGVCGIIGAYFGTQVAEAASPALLKKIFGAFMVITGIKTLFSRGSKI